MKRKGILIIIILLCVYIFACWIFRQSEQPCPFEEAEVWYCEEIDMTIQWVNTDGVPDMVAHWSWPETDQQVFVGTRANIVVFLVECEFNEMPTSKRIWSGTYKSRRGNIIIEVDDNYFGEGISELVFVPIKGQ